MHWLFFFPKAAPQFFFHYDLPIDLAESVLWGWVFLNERGFSVESSLQRIYSEKLL